MIGQTIGQYQIVAVIGQGGMATVYKAYQPSFDRYVAIKVLGLQLSQDPTFVKRFQREAKVVARIEHRNIVPIYDYGEHDGLYYIVMRLIEGGTLRKKMYTHQVGLPLAAHVVEQVGDALDYAHQRDVIHRDLKPSNILLDERENAYLTDFGIAKMLGSNTQVTASGVVGTPSYMSPEQCQGKPLGPASDIYALGAILFEMITNKVPYEADTPLSVMYMHVREPIPSARALNPRLPSTIDRVILRALAKRPDERYPTASALAADFREVTGISEPPKPRPKPRSPLRPTPRPEQQAPLPPPPPPVVVSTPPPEMEQSAGNGFQDMPPVEPLPRRPGFSPSMQGILFGIGGLALLLGLIGAGLLGLSALRNHDNSALVPTLPPPFTVQATELTPAGIVLPTIITPTEITGVIIEPSPVPTEIPPPTLPPTPVPPTNTPAPPTWTPIPPTATPIPPTVTPSNTPTATATFTPAPPTATLVPASGQGKIAYTQGLNTAAEIIVVDINGQGRQQITANAQYDGEPDWSSDGLRIAFEATVGGNTDIYSMAANGTDVRHLTTSPDPDRHPDWSPNGAQIAYESGKDDSTEIYVINADGSGQIRLTNNTFGDRAPKFSPDGARIAYMTHQRGKWEIAVMVYPGGNQIAIYDCPAPDCRFPAWSPDGTQIAYNTLDSQGTEDAIWLLNVASGQSTPLVQNDDNGRPVWSGDGRYLFFNKTVAGNTDLYRLNMLTGDLFRMTADPIEEYAPDWGPG